MHYCLYKAEGTKPKRQIDYTLKHTACFADIFANQVDYETVTIYALKDYSGIPEVVNYGLRITLSEFYEYLVNLKRCGFKFTVREGVVEIREGNRECYQMTLKLKDHSQLANIILMTALRYTYEKDYSALILKFNELCSVRTGPHFLTRFFISQYVDKYDSGHSLQTFDSKFIHYLSDEEIDKVFKVEGFIINTRQLKRFSPMPDNKHLLDVVRTEKPEVIFKEYEKISNLNRE